MQQYYMPVHVACARGLYIPVHVACARGLYIPVHRGLCKRFVYSIGLQ